MFDEYLPPDVLEKQMPDFRSMVKIRVIDFQTKYLPPKPVYDETGNPLPTDPAAAMRAIDYVEYMSLSGDNPDRHINRCPVSELRCVRPPKDEQDWQSQAAWGKWQIVKPLYENWKAGHAIVEEGTPIDAWAGVTPEQAKYIKLAGISTLESFAEAMHGQLAAVRLPNVDALQKHAKRFLENRANNAITTDLQRKDEEINNLRSELAEMRDLMRELAAQNQGKRGRQRKDAEPEQLDGEVA